MSNHLPADYFLNSGQMDYSPAQYPVYPSSATSSGSNGRSGIFYANSAPGSLPQSSGDRRNSSRPGSGTAPVRPAAGTFEQLAGIGLGIGNLFAETLLSHPCVVLRRQCQVNNRASHTHLTPFTLLPSLYSLPSNSPTGIFCFWKGVPSTIILRGLCCASDTILGDGFGLPKEATKYSSYGKIASHLLLKCLTFTLTTPFAISNVIETVQSDVIGERPGTLDCIREGGIRVWSDIVGPHDNRRIPIWYLLGPSIGHRLSHYVLSSVTRFYIHSAVKKQITNKPSKDRTLFDDFFPDLFASFASCLLADAILFPLETVIHRLYLQGVRTLVDNLDTGTAVIPVVSRYEGFFDCVRSIVRDEGWRGFYKGFGALILQYALHMMVLRAVRLLFEQLEEARRRPAQVQPLPPSGGIPSLPGASYESGSITPPRF